MSPPRPRKLLRDSLKRVLVIASNYKPAAQDVARAVTAWLARAGIEAVPDYDGTLDLSQVVEDVDLAISVGGDGTMLSVARRMGPAQVPTMGLNLGKLGFLAEFTERDVREWIAGREDIELRVSQRMRLRCSVAQNGDEVTHYALNDAVVAQGVLTRLISLSMRVNDAHAIRYRADGVIVSTPVGSTAYSLSLGGPILTPGLKAFIVTPIAPHALTNRPIVISGDRRLKLRVDSPVEELALVIDGHEKVPLEAGTEVRIRRAQRDFLVVSPASHSYYDLLRTKLGWGENPRLRTPEETE